MDTKLKFFLIAAVTLTAAIQSCHRSCTSAKYELDGGVAFASPATDSIRVGDTLLFTSLIPVNAKYKPGNSNDSNVLNLSGASNVVTDIHVGILKGFNMQVGAIDSFDFIAIDGKVENSAVASAAAFAKTVTFVESSENFKLTFAIIAKKAGVYSLSILDILSAKKDCMEASISIKQINNETGLHYLKEIYYGGGELATVDSLHAYCFKVY